MDITPVQVKKVALVKAAAAAIAKADSEEEDDEEDDEDDDDDDEDDDEEDDDDDEEDEGGSELNVAVYEFVLCSSTLLSSRAVTIREQVVSEVLDLHKTGTDEKCLK